MMEKTTVQQSVPLQERVDAITAVLLEHKATDLVCMDVSTQSGGGFADRLCIVTASSPRHARALADALTKYCHTSGQDFFGVEGMQLGEWVLVDMNDIIVSIFLESTRSLYRLEDMWSQLSREDHSHE